jgi:hypothetical protein
VQASQRLKIQEWEHPQVSFSVNGTCVILHLRDVVKRWNLCSHAESSSQTPTTLVPIPDEDHPILHEPYRYPIGSEWILD